jgi:uncharacterized protein YdeI (YjbR/CyaY-like superfamily)
MAETKANSKTFRATLERLNGKGISWVIARLPFSVEKQWKTRGTFRVHVEVNGIQYKAALLPTRSGRHFMIVNQKTQKAARIATGSTATFTVRPDLSPRIIQLPKELEAALNQERALRKWFDRLSYTARKWLVAQIENAKSEDTRTRRAERIAETVMEAMVAEHDLPPLMRLAFSRHLGAEQGWNNLTPNQRRHHLLAIFNYRTHQSRLNRIERLIEQSLTKENSPD